MRRKQQFTFAMMMKTHLLPFSIYGGCLFVERFHVLGSELESSKAARARANLEAAGLADLVDIHVGDARETLADVRGEIDLVLLDGAFSLYLLVLELLEPRLKNGALILAENAFDHENTYLDYVRDPTNGYLSQPIPISHGRGNEFTLVTR